ncbi:hypothetical protein [Pseudoclavibacter sp. JSM 162008]|uniref:hypothetical protein n=1 Tax=Pseudoclavibacter sp. JSM 162008 TaxID=3229855 RepID=UPI003525ADE8
MSTTTTPATVTTADSIDLVAAAADLAQIDEQLADLKERRATVVGILEQGLKTGALEEGKKKLLGDVVLTVTAGRKTLNAGMFAEQYPSAKFPELYKDTLNTKAVTDAFAANALEQFKTKSAPSFKASAA